MAQTVCVGFKAHMGWLNAVAVAVRATPDTAPKNLPVAVDARRIDFAGGQPREVGEPYHAAGGWRGARRVTAPADPAAVVARGRAAQARALDRQLRAYQQALAGLGFQWRRAVVLTGRGRLGGDLSRLLASHAQIHVAEGEAVREGLRAALDALSVRATDQDEKDVLGLAVTALQVADPLRMLAAGPRGAGVWRKEERLIALAAWLHRGREPDPQSPA